MKIALIGATGFIGSAILREALDRGHQVTAIVRHPEKLPQHTRLVAQKGDVTSEMETAALVAGHDAVISAYSPGRDVPDIYQQHISGYRKIIDLRDAGGSSCQGKPVVTHTYDWMTPRNSPSRFFQFELLGPWIYPVLVRANVPESQWNAISDYLVDALRTTIKGLTIGSDKLPNFYVVSTQDTLTPAALGETGESGDWMNEIHPGSDGYKKIATKIGRRVRGLL